MAFRAGTSPVHCELLSLVPACPYSCHFSHALRVRVRVRVSQAAPHHIIRQAPLLLHVLPIAACGAGCEQHVQALVAAGGRYFGCAAAVMYEVDVAQETMLQRVGPRHQSPEGVLPLAGVCYFVHAFVCARPAGIAGPPGPGV